MTLIIQKPTGAKLNLAKTYTEGDRSFSSVSLLLHGDGTNGSTTITDSSPSPKTVTAVGNAQISTAQSKFGGASVAFDGTGDWLTVPANIGFNFGTADFTVEYWIYWNSIKAGENHVQIGGSSNVLGTTTGNRLEFFANAASRILDSVAVTAGTWFHVALAKASGQTRLFKNGTQVGSTYSDSNNYSNAEMRLFARTDAFNSSAPLDGYIDDLRITKGVARYTANFTPPTAAFADAQF
jgi:hypothetical protein